jgi:hypothetical protein
MKDIFYCIFDAAVTFGLMAVVLVSVALLALRTFLVIYLVVVTFALRPIFHTVTGTKNKAVKKDV